MKKYVESESKISKMMIDESTTFDSEEDLARHLIHRFNIPRETVESMPAFKKHISPLFLEEDHK